MLYSIIIKCTKCWNFCPDFWVWKSKMQKRMTSTYSGFSAFVESSAVFRLLKKPPALKPSIFIQTSQRKVCLFVWEENECKLLKLLLFTESFAQAENCSIRFRFLTITASKPTTMVFKAIQVILSNKWDWNGLYGATNLILAAKIVNFYGINWKQ